MLTQCPSDASKPYGSNSLSQSSGIYDTQRTPSPRLEEEGTLRTLLGKYIKSRIVIEKIKNRINDEMWYRLPEQESDRLWVGEYCGRCGDKSKNCVCDEEINELETIHKELNAMIIGTLVKELRPTVETENVDKLVKLYFFGRKKSKALLENRVDLIRRVFM